jgi:hypothetical protein
VDKTTWNADVVEFLIGLQEKTHDFIAAGNLPIYTSHHRTGMVFRGHPNYCGKGPWRDWVWIDWGSAYGRFVVLTGMPTGRHSIKYGGITLQDGTFAVVETATIVNNDEFGIKSDLMMPITKDVELDDARNVTKRTFSLADTEAFCDPCCVIPNLGGGSNAYFVVKPRNQWAGEFIRWVEDQHVLDKMDDLVPLEKNSDEEDNERPKKRKKLKKKSGKK